MVKMEILMSNYIASNLKVKQFFEKEKLGFKFRYVEEDYSAYIDFMRCKAQRLPVVIKDGFYIQSSNIKEIKSFINGKIKGEAFR